MQLRNPSMRWQINWRGIWWAGVALLVSPAMALAQQLPAESRLFSNAAGVDAAFSNTAVNGAIDFSHPFFLPISQQFGGNERSCGSCHRPEQGWSITPPKLQALFDLTEGLDPIFLPVDGTNAINSDQSTLEARRQASSLLLKKGLIRVEMPVQPSFQFTLISVTTPVDGSFPEDFAADALARQVISVYRRPQPTANLNFLTDLMWDGREAVVGRSLNDRLLSQALGAMRGHMQGTTIPSSVASLTPEQLALVQGIVDFERSIMAAQMRDVSSLSAGSLDTDGGFGGPLPLLTQPPQLSQGGVFNLFTSWSSLVADPLDHNFIEILVKQQVARGEALFNTRMFATGIVGIASCSTCHGVRAIGNSTTGRRFNLGLSAPNITVGGAPANLDLPVYTIRHKVSGQLIRTTDPGRIMVTGTFGTGDGDAFKVPSLRGLASRSPYFHGGQAPDLISVVNFYNNRFNIGLTDQERADMAAFLRSL